MKPIKLYILIINEQDESFFILVFEINICKKKLLHNLQRNKA